MKLKPIEKITWEDAHGDSSLQSPEDMKGALEVAMTVGFVIKQNKKVVIIAAEYFPSTDQYRDTTTIPKVNIIKRERLGGVDAEGIRTEIKARDKETRFFKRKSR